MSLELKHLTPYLPYDVWFTATEFSANIGEYRDQCGTLTLFDLSRILDREYKDVKLGLIPLSELTFERHINLSGKKQSDFLIYYDSSYNTIYKQGYQGKHYRIPEELPYSIIQKLFEWHFDVFGLIDQGLAIDIKSLNQPES